MPEAAVRNEKSPTTLSLWWDGSVEAAAFIFWPYCHLFSSWREVHTIGRYSGGIALGDWVVLFFALVGIALIPLAYFGVWGWFAVAAAVYVVAIVVVVIVALIDMALFGSPFD